MAQNFIPRGSRTVDVQPLPDSMWQRYNNRPGLLSTLATGYEYYNKLPRELKQKIAKLFEGEKEPSALERLRALKVEPTSVNEPEYNHERYVDDAEEARAAEQARIAKERATKELTAEQARANTELNDYAQSPDGREITAPQSLAWPDKPQIKGPGANLRMGELTRGEKFADQIMDAQEALKAKEALEKKSTDEEVASAIEKIMGQYQ